MKCALCALELDPAAGHCPRCGAVVGSAVAPAGDDRTRDRSTLLAERAPVGSSLAGFAWESGPRTLVATRGQSSGVVLASAGVRLAAQLIDALALGAGYFLAMLALGVVTMGFVGASRPAVAVLEVFGQVLVVVGAGVYQVVLNGHGQTLGKRALGIAVVDRSTGAPVGVARAAQRYLMLLVMALPCGLGLLSVPLSTQLRGWHDQVADDLVVELPRRR
ncbi:MAG: RDD family protein [Actinobacteria bacterium]|nr:RDD family protein [Actinomycetota bacterium]